MNKMDFREFCRIMRDIFQTLSRTQLQKIFPHQRTKQLELQKSIHCYLMIFHNSLQHFATLKPINEYFLDLETPTTPLPPHTIIVPHDSQTSYVFTIDDIINIFHTNLSQSTVEYNHTYKLCTLTRSFCPPRNAYTGLPFTIAQVKWILTQMALYNETHHLKRFPEVQTFVMFLDKFYDKIQGIDSDYDMTEHIIDFFDQHSLMFVQKYGRVQSSSELCYNNSHWKNKKKKQVNNNFETRLFGF